MLFRILVTTTTRKPRVYADSYVPKTSCMNSAYLAGAHVSGRKRFDAALASEVSRKEKRSCAAYFWEWTGLDWTGLDWTGLVKRGLVKWIKIKNFSSKEHQITIKFIILPNRNRNRNRIWVVYTYILRAN